MATSEHIKAKLELLPVKPGCYLMKDEAGNILYVGKAKVLKNRVNSYFHGVHNYKTTKLVSHIRDFEFIVTGSEKEALLLEINLIKEHRPPYNIMFMDDKMYPYIEVTNDEEFAVRITRRPKGKKSQYFGPYPISTYAKDIVQLINQIFPIRKCRKIPSTSCLYYHIHQCLAPCIREVDPSEYAAMKKQVIEFLKGNTTEIENRLKKQMDEAVENLQFERAQEIHERLLSIEHIKEKQTIDFSDRKNRDVFGWYEDKGYISLQGLIIREGKMLERTFSINPIYEDWQDAFVAFILQYYQNNTVPREIFVPEGTPVDMLESILNTKVKIPERGEKKKLLDMAMKNAKEAHEQKFNLVYKKDQELDAAVRHLSKLLSKDIVSVELLDNSHTQGSFNVSGLVRFENGKPNKSQYRKFQLDGYTSDTDSMKEVIKRRYGRLQKENKPFPDLLLLDGGKPQISAAKEVVDEMHLPLTIAGLVKDDKHTTRALMNDEYQELNLEKTDPLFFLLERMQDEVHRYAISYHRNLRGKSMTKSLLDEVPGIGEKRKKNLMKHFKSMKQIRQASLKELEEVLPKNTASILYERLQEDLKARKEKE